MRKSFFSIWFSLPLLLSHCSFDTAGLRASGPQCGNGAQEEGEACDGEDLTGQTCESLGYDAGTLACTAACAFDRSGCSGGTVECGNGIVEDGELCDGGELGGQTCVSLGYTGGTLACGEDCRPDTSGCEGTACGNGTVDLTEDCDGVDLGGVTCASLGWYGGALACRGDCTFDLSACIETGRCGDGLLQPDRGEQCDGQNLNDESCASLGYYGGALACTSGCQLDLGPCLVEGRCGDDAVQNSHAEECDGANLDGESCASLGYYGGELSCDSDCLFDLEICAAAGRCGDESVQEEGGEECDGANLEGRSCVSLGYYGGTLGCASDCSLDLASCAAAGRCGDATIQAGEGEQCDGVELAGARCRHRGFFGGTLACADGCLFDTAACDPSRLEGSSARDYARDMVIDSAGNVFVVGITEGQVGAVHHGGSDIVVVKWNVDGQRQWVVQLGTSGTDLGFGLLLDSAGALYVTGAVGGALSGQTHQGGSDVAIFKLNALTGALVWHRQYGSTGDDTGRALALDGSDNVYVAGYTTGTIPSGGMNELVNLGNNDVFLMRLTPLGAYSWGQMHGSTGNDYGLDLRSFGGKLYLAGNTGGVLGSGSSAGGHDAFVARYTLAGTRETVLQFGTANAEQGYSLADDGTHLYFAGTTEGTFPGNTSAGAKDLFVAKIDPTTMTRAWTVQRGTSSNEDVYRILHTAGSLFVVGSSPGTFPGNTGAGSNDAFWFRLAASDGATHSARQWGTSGFDIGYGIARDPSGTLCLSGYLEGSFMGDLNQGGADIGVWCVTP